MNCSEKSLEPIQPLPQGIQSCLKLTIQGLGEIPGFKNSKSIFRNKEGKPFIATNPEFKVWMERAIRLLEYQLRSGLQTIGTGMPMEHSQHCLIALSKQSGSFDDSVKWIPEMSVRAVKCKPGEEGAEIIIERIG